MFVCKKKKKKKKKYELSGPISQLWNMLGSCDLVCLLIR